MIVQDVITRVRRVFGDEAAVQVTDDDIKRWINDGQIQIVKHNDAALQATDFINIVANQSTYALSSNVMILRSLRYKLPGMLSFSALKYKNMQEFDDSVDGWDGSAYTTGSPQFFTKYENNVVLFPTPNQSMTAGLKMLYNQTPPDVSDLSDPLSLPLIYHNTIVNYCLWQASLLDEDHEPALMFKAGFQEDMNLLMTRETTEATATYPTITVLSEDQ